MQLATGNLPAVQADFANRVEHFRRDCDGDGTARSQAAQELFTLRWGPTDVPIYNLLGLSSELFPHKRAQQLEIARWLTMVAKVPVNGTDASGTTALAHAISTHPAFDPELAQILYEAGGDVNLRNRYGATPAHAMCMILSLDRKDLQKSEEALAWFMTHGGNVDVKDGDGFTARVIAGLAAKKLASKGGNKLLEALEKEEKRREQRKDTCCTFCGREDSKLLLCGRCKKAKYCEPSGRQCQKIDWPRHKSGCKST